MSNHIDVKSHRKARIERNDVSLHRQMTTTLAQRWRAAREAAGLRFNELDRAIKQTSGYSSPIEAGTKKNPQLGTVALAASVLNVSPLWLAFGQGPMTPTESASLDFPAATLLLKLHHYAGLEKWVEDHPGDVTVLDLVRGVQAMESGRAAAYARSEDQEPHAGWGAFFADLRAGKFDPAPAGTRPSGGIDAVRAAELAELGSDRAGPIRLPSIRLPARKVLPGRAGRRAKR